MLELQVRKANIDDLDAICEVENLSFHTPWSRESYEHELTENPLCSFYVGLWEGKIVAFAGYWRILDEAHITNVAVHPAYRGQGLGKVIMQAIMLSAAQEDCHWMTLEVRKSNTVAQGLYTGLGFKAVGERPHYYENDEAAIIMWRNI